jgi:hypothetical protein
LRPDVIHTKAIFENEFPTDFLKYVINSSGRFVSFDPVGCFEAGCYISGLQVSQMLCRPDVMFQT